MFRQLRGRQKVQSLCTFSVTERLHCSRLSAMVSDLMEDKKTQREIVTPNTPSLVKSRNNSGLLLMQHWWPQQSGNGSKPLEYSLITLVARVWMSLVNSCVVEMGLATRAPSRNCYHFVEDSARTFFDPRSWDNSSVMQCLFSSARKVCTHLCVLFWWWLFSCNNQSGGSEMWKHPRVQEGGRGGGVAVSCAYERNVSCVSGFYHEQTIGEVLSG